MIVGTWDIWYLTGTEYENTKEKVNAKNIWNFSFVGGRGGSDGISFHMFVGCDVMKIILRCCWKLKYYHLSRDYQSVMQAFAIFIHDRNYIASTKNVTAVCSRAMLIGGKMKKVFTRIAREKRR